MAETIEHVETPKGTIVAGRYEVERLIARGGMAAVYLASQVNLNRKVAIKILSPPTGEEDAALFEDRFRLEAETLAGLSHPNIVVLHDYGELDDGRVFLAMEYIEGPRLTDVLKDGPLPWERALTLIGQVVRALRYAHKLGVVHRDLKPSNLLITHDIDGKEIVKVVDFGLVKLTEGDQSITRAGLILGSPHCMSPEQVRGNDVDHRTDIYAIGVLLFRTLTGKYPFHGANSTATMIEHLHAETPTFFSVSPDIAVPDGLEELVRKCLRKDRDERHHDTTELLNQIRDCMANPPESFRTTGHTATTLERSAFPAPLTQKPLKPSLPWRSVLPWLAALFAFGFMLLLLGGGTAGFLLIRPTIAPVVEPARPMPLPKPVAAEPAPKPLVEPAPPQPSEPQPVEPPSPAPVRPKPVRPKPVRPKPVVPAPVRPKPVVPAPVAEPKPEKPPGYMDLPDF